MPNVEKIQKAYGVDRGTARIAKSEGRSNTVGAKLDALKAQPASDKTAGKIASLERAKKKIDKKTVRLAWDNMIRTNLKAEGKKMPDTSKVKLSPEKVSAVSKFTGANKATASSILLEKRAEKLGKKADIAAFTGKSPARVNNLRSRQSAASRKSKDFAFKNMVRSNKKNGDMYTGDPRMTG